MTGTSDHQIVTAAKRLADRAKALIASPDNMAARQSYVRAAFNIDLTAAAVAHLADRPGAWRCFHCDETFTSESCARDHFGPTEESKPACQIKAGAERGLLGALRQAEKELADAWQAIQNENTEAARAYYAQNSRHRVQLMAAEEAGYERGLADGRNLGPSQGDAA